jgi:hypothetical protein
LDRHTTCCYPSKKGQTLSNRRFIFHRLIHCHEVKINTNAIGKRLERMLGMWQELPSACAGVQGAATKIRLEMMTMDPDTTQ